MQQMSPAQAPKYPLPVYVNRPFPKVSIIHDEFGKISKHNIWKQKFRQKHTLETTLRKFEMAELYKQQHREPINELLTSCDDHYPEDGKDRQDGGTGFLSGYGAHVIHVNKNTAHRNGENGNNEGQNILPIAHSIKDTGDQEHDRCDYQTHQRTGQCFQGSLGGLFQGISNRHQGKDANRPRCKIL